MTRCACAAAALVCSAWPAHASSTSASSASDSSATSIGSLSDSVQGSSDSSSHRHRDAAAGNYRIVDIAALHDRPGRLRLRLQALDTPGEAGTLWLQLPQATVERQALAVGGQISAQARPYGVAFAQTPGGAPFFLALDDHWQRELAARPVL